MEKQNKTLIAKAITPFDKDNVENLNTMEFELNRDVDVKIVSDKIGKRSQIKQSLVRQPFTRERRLIK